MDDASLSKTRWCRLFRLTAMFAVAIASGCSTYIGTTSKSFLREARENGDPNIRYVAYAKLGTPSVYENEAQKDEAIQLLVTKLQRGQGAGGRPCGHRPKLGQPGRSPCSS